MKANKEDMAWACLALLLPRTCATTVTPALSPPAMACDDAEQQEWRQHACSGPRQCERQVGDLSWRVQPIITPDDEPRVARIYESL
eukprot:536558-Prymnesium_polylepis.1